MINKGKISLRIVFSCYFACIPILQYYELPGLPFNIATSLAFVFLLLFLLKLLKNPLLVIEKRILPFRIYILFIFLNVIITTSLYNYNNTWANWSSFIRLLFLYISLLVFGSQYFDLEIAFNFLEKVLYVSAFFIFIHVILYEGFHIRFNPIIESLVSTESLHIELNNVRSGGLYMEPAHYSQSAVLYLCYKLFPIKGSFQKLEIKTIIIILGVIFSGSGQGYIMIVLIYFIWLFYTMFIKKASAREYIKVFLSIGVCFVLLVVALQIPFVQNAVSRFTSNGNYGFGGSALAGRSYTNHYFAELSEQMKMTGVGFGRIALVTRGGFTNSLYSHLIQCGYPSIIVLAFIFLYYFFKGPVAAKVHCVLYAIMIVFSSIANPMMLCFFVQFYIGLVKSHESLQYEGGKKKYDRLQ